MNPLMAIALADLVRAADVAERRARTRASKRMARTEATTPGIVARDGAWAAAISRWSRAEDDAGCSTVGCATA